MWECFGGSAPALRWGACGRTCAERLGLNRLRLGGVCQERVQEAVGALADLDEQVSDTHAALEAQLLQQLHVQDLLRWAPHCSSLLRLIGLLDYGTPIALCVLAASPEGLRTIDSVFSAS